MSSDDVLRRLHQLGFRLPIDALKEFLEHAAREHLSPLGMAERLVELERREREARNLAARTRLAMLGKFQTLERFDWNHPRKIDRALYERLRTTLDFVERGENALLRGPSGVGKTTLAQNLGLAALTHGYSVRFCTLAGMLADLLRRDSLPAFERRLRRYVRPRLLVLDEIGYLPCDNRSADLLYNIVSRRHEARSIVITTNLPFRQWGTVFPGAACVAALVDRFVQHCHVIDIDAESWRQRTSLQHHNGRSIDGQDRAGIETR
ncbi:MAG: IS21-like element helper ATPase IstB [Myxococcota bacterium]|nr:IS21-like element helper ATPase IstB [Myxococcota bacterium]